MVRALGAILTVGFVVSVLSLIAWCIPDPRAKVIQAEKDDPARFESVGEVLVQHRSAYDLTGTIYRDRETDIEYLYIWDGANNGGPTMTRLWKKGE